MRVWSTILFGALGLACREEPLGPGNSVGGPVALHAPPAASAPPAPPGMPDWQRAIRHEVVFEPATGELAVRVHLEPGFHAYTVGETVGRPLKVELDPAAGVRIDGEVRYPAGHERNLPVGKSVIVEGDVEIRAKLAAEGALGGKTARGAFHYQVCTEEACDRPRRAPIELALSAGGANP